MSVHYKFKSSVTYDTVTFDGLHISVSDLKKSILQQKKIGKSADFDLQITNAQTKEVFSAEDDLVPKNTSVIVARVPVTNPVKKSWERNDASTFLPGNESPTHVAFDKLAKTADLANANATEDEKIKAMMTQSAHEYDPSKYVKSRSMTGPLPVSYVCFRCGKSGHWIKNCPTNNAEIKRSTGIPRSFMVTVDGPDIKGALLTSSGDFAVPLIDQQAYKQVKKEKPPFLKEEAPNPEPELQIPEDLLCLICRDLLEDAVLIPCCGNSFCDECIRQALLDSENHECPLCHETDTSPDSLIPNRFQRNAVQNFKNETGYIKYKKNLLLGPSASASASAVSSSTTVASSGAQAPSDQPSSVHNPKQQSDECSGNPEANASVLLVVSKEQERQPDRLPFDKRKPADHDFRHGAPLLNEPPRHFKPRNEMSMRRPSRFPSRPYNSRTSHSQYRYKSVPASAEPNTISTITTRGNDWGIRRPFRGRNPGHHYDSSSQNESRDQREYAHRYRYSAEPHQRSYHSDRNYRGRNAHQYRHDMRHDQAEHIPPPPSHGGPPPPGPRYVPPSAGFQSHHHQIFEPPPAAIHPPPVNVHQPQQAPYIAEPPMPPPPPPLQRPPPGPDPVVRPQPRPVLLPLPTPVPPQQPPPHGPPHLPNPGAPPLGPSPATTLRAIPAAPLSSSAANPLRAIPPAPLSGSPANPLRAIPSAPPIAPANPLRAIPAAPLNAAANPLRAIPPAPLRAIPPAPLNPSAATTLRAIPAAPLNPSAATPLRAIPAAPNRDPPPPSMGPLLSVRPLAPSTSVHSVPAVPSPVPPTSTSPQSTYADDYSRHLDVYRQSNLYFNKHAKIRKWSKDPMDDFAQELLEYQKENRLLKRSRSSSYHSSSSWSRSRSRSYSRSVSRSRSRSFSTSFSSRSRSRSYSRSRSRSHFRSRSRSSVRSYSRSRSRSRSSNKSGYQSPSQKFNSRHSYDRSRSRSPIKQFSSYLKPYYKHSERHSPSSHHSPSHQQSVSQRSSSLERYGSNRAHHEPYPMNYDTQPFHKERKLSTNISSQDSYPQYADKYVNTRKFHDKLPEERALHKQDAYAGRIEVLSGYRGQKFRERSPDILSNPSRKEDLIRDENRPWESKYRGDNKNFEAPFKSNEYYNEPAPTLSPKNIKPTENKKYERPMKDHRQRQGNIKANVIHKTRRRESPDDTSKVSGMELERPRTNRKLVKVVKPIVKVLESEGVDHQPWKPVSVKSSDESINYRTKAYNANYADELLSSRDSVKSSNIHYSENFRRGVGKKERASDEYWIPEQDNHNYKDKASTNTRHHNIEVKDSSTVENIQKISVLEAPSRRLPEWEKDYSEKAKLESRYSPMSRKRDSAQRLQKQDRGNMRVVNPTSIAKLEKDSKFKEPSSLKSGVDKLSTVSENTKNACNTLDSNVGTRKKMERKDWHPNTVVTESKNVYTASRDTDRNRPESIHRSKNFYNLGRRKDFRNMHTMLPEFPDRTRPRSIPHFPRISTKREGRSNVPYSAGTRLIRHRKTSKDHQHDESNFEPNYDETSDSGASTKCNRDTLSAMKRKAPVKNESFSLKHGKSSRSTHTEPSRRNPKYEKFHAKKDLEYSSVSSVKHLQSRGDTEPRGDSTYKKGLRDVEEYSKHSEDLVESASYSSMDSESETHTNISKKSKNRSLDIDEKHERRSKHKKHKKHKHKHKRRKSINKDPEEAKVMSSVVRK